MGRIWLGRSSFYISASKENCRAANGVEGWIGCGGGGSIEISIKFLWFHWQIIISVSKEKNLDWELAMTVRQPKGRKYCFGSHQVSLQICFKAWYGQGWPFSAYEDNGALVL